MALAVANLLLTDSDSQSTVRTADIRAAAERAVPLAAAQAALASPTMADQDAQAERVDAAIGKWREALAELRQDAATALPLPPP